MESRCSSHFALEAVVYFRSCWSWMVGKNGLWSFRLCGSPAGATCFAQSALIYWGILCILSHRFSAMPFLPASIRNSLESPQSTADEAEMEVVVCHKSLRLVWWQWWQWVLSPKSQLEISIFLSPSWCFFWLFTQKSMGFPSSSPVSPSVGMARMQPFLEAENLGEGEEPVGFGFRWTVEFSRINKHNKHLRFYLFQWNPLLPIFSQYSILFPLYIQYPFPRFNTLQ